MDASFERDVSVIPLKELLHQSPTLHEKTQPIRKALRTPKFVLSEAIYLRTKKKLLRRKRFLPENTCFVDPKILWSYSALMWKQTGHKH